MITIILFILNITSGVGHDLQVAYYKIYQEADKVQVAFVFEKNDLHAALNLKNGDWSEPQLLQYIYNNFSISINGTPQNLILGDIKTKHKHIHVLGTTSNNIDHISAIKIKNTCLNNIEYHSNIIELKLGEKQRDFLMNKERTSILVEY